MTSGRAPLGRVPDRARARDRAARSGRARTGTRRSPSSSPSGIRDLGPWSVAAAGGSQRSDDGNVFVRSTLPVIGGSAIVTEGSERHYAEARIEPGDVVTVVGRVVPFSEVADPRPRTCSRRAARSRRPGDRRGPCLGPGAGHSWPRSARTPGATRRSRASGSAGRSGRRCSIGSDAAAAARADPRRPGPRRPSRSRPTPWCSRPRRRPLLVSRSGRRRRSSARQRRPVRPGLFGAIVAIASAMALAVSWAARGMTPLSVAAALRRRAARSDRRLRPRRDLQRRRRPRAADRQGVGQHRGRPPAAARPAAGPRRRGPRAHGLRAGRPDRGDPRPGRVVARRRRSPPRRRPPPRRRGPSARSSRPSSATRRSTPPRT